MNIRRMAVVVAMITLLGWASSMTAPPSLMAQSQAVLQVSPTSLSFNAEVGSLHPGFQFLTLGNAGTAVLKWEASTDVGWVILGSPAGRLAPGQIIRLLVLLDVEGLGVGTHEGTVTIEDPGTGEGR